MYSLKIEITFLPQHLGLSIFYPNLDWNNPEFLAGEWLGCFNPTLGQIWTNPAIGFHFSITFLTQRLGLSIFYSMVSSDPDSKHMIQ